MNVTVIVVELLIMFLVICLLLINPVTFISDYPPEIQEIYYKSQNKEAEKENKASDDSKDHHYNTETKCFIAISEFHQQVSGQMH